ncbi:tRNA pseudouridine(55) synthase TruB [Croceicoccus pelagius]|uniref:tRNA pseudouridine synthase B n=1 Tax=Croceicoccus pelagius TaxID=1703341 RepID=A0A916YN24_9SPHN|nr:tRNA pseudouridine(55) synthase TruB [Croceicoccus pelagius]GGD52506.1 tRNA pseudouridine synthase B [Croceicoccus pelagius]
MPHGWIILDKPLELGSTQAVAAVKRNLRQAGFGKVKVGHGGTLDPLATGVLPIAVGEATKLAGRMLEATKAYAFTLAFGAETTTLDAEGEVTETSDVRPTCAEIEAILPRFTGPIEQVPPAYSALKVDGKRAYDLARAGEEVTLKTRSVTIHALDITEITADSVTLVAKVSKGTYIRSLARDIARALGSVGHVTMLRRVKAGPFSLENAISLDKLNELGKGAPLEEMILPFEAGLDDIPALALTPDAAGAVRQGRKLSGLPEPDGTYWGREGDTPVALMEVTDGEARVLRGFNL